VTWQTEKVHVLKTMVNWRVLLALGVQ
jgi:hypothetical protein